MANKKAVKKAVKAVKKATKKSTSSSKYITVNVTKTGITKGKRYSTSSCPVARALKVSGLKKVDVGLTSVIFTKQGHSYVLELPKTVTKFIENFDGGRKVKPFSFRLNLGLNLE